MKVTTYRLPDSDTIQCELTGSIKDGVLTVDKVHSGALAPGYFLGFPHDGHRISQSADGAWLIGGDPQDESGLLMFWNREVYSMAGEADHRVPENAVDVITVESAEPQKAAPVPAWGFDLSL